MEIHNRKTDKEIEILEKEKEIILKKEYEDYNILIKFRKWKDKEDMLHLKMKNINFEIIRIDKLLEQFQKQKKYGKSK